MTPHPDLYNPRDNTPVAYFSMEYAIHQPLKIYAGGLGFLAGSHLRSAAHLGKNMIGIGILWKYGYYDQERQSDQRMEVAFVEKFYGFLEPTHLTFQIQVNGKPVNVTAYYLPPDCFGTVPLFLLTTDLPENDYLARTISHKLYDSNPETRIAQSILLGQGGVKLLDALDLTPAIYHLNESHALPAAFALFEKWHDWQRVRQHLVFTNHTPEEGGNPKADIRLLERMGFWGSIPTGEIRQITQTPDTFLDYTVACLRLAKVANGVSQIHTETLRRIYGQRSGICPLISITNAQNDIYWADEELYARLNNPDGKALRQRKQQLKHPLIEEVADQTGEVYRPAVFTLVWARRFAGYKRADLLLNDPDRFHRLVSNPAFPVQIIWAGKPYPVDYPGIATFDRLVDVCKRYNNCTILTGYELRLSRILKQGADVWLNTPRLTHEASGTSGMTAAMNGAINLSTMDGWFPEFVHDQVNGFALPPCDLELPDFDQDKLDATHLYDKLEQEIIPLYYQQPDRWVAIMKASLQDILPYFGSDRMVSDYYEHLYESKTESLPSGTD